MDKIQKFLSRLSRKELRNVEEALTTLHSGTTRNLDIKKLKGFNDVFRLRVQDIRIIYQKQGDRIELIDIGRRSEDTYKNL